MYLHLVLGGDRMLNIVAFYDGALEVELHVLLPLKCRRRPLKGLRHPRLCLRPLARRQDSPHLKLIRS